MLNFIQTPGMEKHREAGRAVAAEYEGAVKEVHLRIKHRGTVTTWAVRHGHRRHHGA